jgi:hypothetical protein
VKIDQELQIVRVTRVVIAVAGAPPNTFKHLDKAQTHDWVLDYGGKFLAPTVPVRMSKQR